MPTKKHVEANTVSRLTYELDYWTKGIQKGLASDSPSDIPNTTVVDAGRV